MNAAAPLYARPESFRGQQGTRGALLAPQRRRGSGSIVDLAKLADPETAGMAAE